MKNNNTTPKAGQAKNWSKEFDKREDWATNAVKFGNQEWEVIVADKAKLKSFITQTLQNQRESIIKDVEGMKKETQKETGAYKYDFAYDEVIKSLTENNE